MVTAFILIVVKPGTEESVAEKLGKLEEIKDIGIVYGEYDIIAKVQVPTMEDLQNFVIRIRKNPDIERTSTMITTK
jgi:DNA-binding Lrp family transcriptional regulator